MTENNGLRVVKRRNFIVVDKEEIKSEKKSQPSFLFFFPLFSIYSLNDVLIILRLQVPV